MTICASLVPRGHEVSMQSFRNYESTRDPIPSIAYSFVLSTTTRATVSFLKPCMSSHQKAGEIWQRRRVFAEMRVHYG
eukprot:2111700-Pleurochrysis_carterae.AAC.1